MANEIIGKHDSGLTAVFIVYYDNEGAFEERTQESNDAAEVGTTGIYTASPSAIVAGDLVGMTWSDGEEDWNIYRPADGEIGAFHG